MRFRPFMMAGRPPLTVNLSSSGLTATVFGSAGATGTTGAVTASVPATGDGAGSGSYTYSWVGSAGVTPNSPSAASTTFGVVDGSGRSATVIVTDTVTGRVGQATISLACAVYPIPVISKTSGSFSGAAGGLGYAWFTISHLDVYPTGPLWGNGGITGGSVISGTGAFGAEANIGVQRGPTPGSYSATITARVVKNGVAYEATFNEPFTVS